MESRIGIVIIGRNLGAQLAQTIQAAKRQAAAVVYVDSGSTDHSIRYIQAENIPLIELDASQPYTAARARNAGAEFLLRQMPSLEYIQFVDGDCLLADGFIEAARQVMDAEARIAIVCGQRRERFPEASVYHRLAALEWESATGEIAYCGGDALVRAAAFLQVNGYNARLIAGEEPDLCLRLRRAGWKIWGIGADMTYHDARMLRFGQWWRRSVRAGHAYAEGAWRHGSAPEHHWVRESASIWAWGAAVWLGALGLASITRGASLLFLISYPLLAARIYRRGRQRGWSASNAQWYALFCVLGKFPQLQGQIIFLMNHLHKALL